MVLIDFKSKVNKINFAYAAKLSFWVQKINMNIQKINNSFLETYNIFIDVFWVFDKRSHLYYIKERFLIFDISIKVLFDILFLIFNNVNI